RRSLEPHRQIKVSHVTYDKTCLYQYKCSCRGVTEVPLFAAFRRRRMVATLPCGLTSNLKAGPESRGGHLGAQTLWKVAKVTKSSRKLKRSAACKSWSAW